MPGYSHGFLSNLNQILDPPMRRKIEDLRNTVRYIQGLQTNDTAVYNVHVSDWLRQSQDLLDDICELRIEEKIEDKFPNRLRPYLYSRLNLVIAVDDTVKKVTEQVEVGRNALRGFERSVSSVVLGSQALNAYKRILHNVSESKDVPRIIRVSGRPGVGKTTVVSKIHNHALEGLREGPSFNKVFWVQTAPNATLKDLQCEIAKKVYVDLSAASDDEGRARILLAALMMNERSRRILLILDLWKDFTLEMIGIPEPSTQNGYKLVIICRTLLVGVGLENNNDGNEAVVADVEIKSPSELETTNVFAKLVGEERVQYIPEETWSMLLEECDCLPLVIVNLEKTIEKWLRTSLAAKDISKGIRNAVAFFKFPYELLKDSYESLREETRPYFFYCALYPSLPNNANDLIETEDMIRCWICDGLMGANDSGGDAFGIEYMNTMMKKGKEIVEEIKNSYLLDIVYRDEGKTQCIKMKKSVREMVAHISSTDCFFIKVGDAKKHMMTRVVVSEKVERASVASDQLEELGRESKKTLSTLLVRNKPNYDKLEFAARLFNEIPNVKVLDLSGTHIQSFPSNFSVLKNLRALRLRNCIHLESLPDMSSFVELLVLDISDTSLTNLPSGLNVLKKLLRLDISFTPMKIFPFTNGLLSNLTGLQELLMMSSYVWTGEENVADLKRLTKLAHLEAHFSDIQSLRRFVFSERAEGCCPPKFRFSVGKLNFNQKLHENTLAVLIENIPIADLGLMVSLPRDNSLHLMFNKNLELLPLQYNRPPSLQHLTAITISDCGALINLFEADMFDSVPNLHKIVVERCEKMVALIREPSHGQAVSLGKLQELVLFQLEKLEHICNARIHCESLESISVWDCDKLKAMPPVAQGRENKQILLKGTMKWFKENKWMEMSTDLPVVYTKHPEASAPQEFYSKPKYTDHPNDSRRKSSATDDDKPKVITIMWVFMCYLAMLHLISRFIAYKIGN